MPRQKPTKVRLTARSIDGLAVREVAYDVFDAEVKGYHVRIHPSGVVSFALRYRDPAGGNPARYHRLVLGSYGTITPEGARAIARERRAEVERGHNPVRDARLRRNAMTFDDAVTLFVEHLRQSRSVRYADEAERVLRKHCAPLGGDTAPRRAPTTGSAENWGPRPVASIARAEILELHQRMKRTPVLANAVVRILSALFTFASKQGWPGVLGNPVMPRPSYTERARGRVLSDLDAAKLGEALRDAAAGGAPWQAIGVIRLAFLSGMRREEAATLRWDAIDIPHARVVLAATKTGRSERPLGASTITLLNELRAVAPKLSPFVFPSPDDPKKPYRGTPKHWARVRAAAGLEDVRFHDLRHDTATETGMRYPLGVLMAITGHADAKTATRYLHQHDSPTKRAADDVTERRAAKLSAEIDPRTGKLKASSS